MRQKSLTLDTFRRDYAVVDVRGGFMARGPQMTVGSPKVQF